MIAFIDDQREAHGVEPICKVLPIAPSTYHEHAAKRARPREAVGRHSGTKALKPEIGASSPRTSRCMARARCGGR